MVTVVLVEGEVRDLGPDAAPSPGEDAGAHGIRGGLQPEKDHVEEIVRKTADAAVDDIAARAAATTATVAHDGYVSGQLGLDWCLYIGKRTQNHPHMGPGFACACKIICVPFVARSQLV